jgi:hypothetical protein
VKVCGSKKPCFIGNFDGWELTAQIMNTLYGSLKNREIRLLVIEPSLNSDAVIKCSVQAVSLDSKPEYIALSYVWGDAAITTDIILNDEFFAATVNLAAALRQIRGFRALESRNSVKDLPAFLWVDAICLYIDRYQRKYHRNFRFRPLFSKGFRSTSRINIHEVPLKCTTWSNALR